MNVPPKAKKDKTCSIPYLLYDNDVQLPRHLNGKDKEADFFSFFFSSVYQGTSPGLKVTQIINHLDPFRGEKAFSLFTKPAVKSLSIMKLAVTCCTEGITSQTWLVVSGLRSSKKKAMLEIEEIICGLKMRGITFLITHLQCCFQPIGMFFSI